MTGRPVSNYSITNPPTQFVGRRVIALLAVVREAAALFSAVPHLPLFDVPHGIRQSYRTVHRAHRGSAGHQPAARIPDRTIHSGRRSEGSPEKSGNADHGWSADCDCRYGADAAGGGPEQSLRVDCGIRDLRVWNDWIRRRLQQSGAPSKSWPHGTGEVRSADCNQHRDRGHADCDADLWNVLDEPERPISQTVPSRSGGSEPGAFSTSLAARVPTLYCVRGVHDCGIEQCGEPYRRARWTGDRVHGDCRSRPGRADLRQWPRDLCNLSGTAAYAAGGRGDDFLRGDGGIVDRIFMVQRASGGSVHGRCGIAGAERGDWDGRGDHQAGTAAAVYWRSVRDRGSLGDPAGGLV